jgi:hypothetical protein
VDYIFKPIFLPKPNSHHHTKKIMHWSKNSAFCSINWNQHFRRREEIFEEIRNKHRGKNHREKFSTKGEKLLKPFFFSFLKSHKHTHSHKSEIINTHTKNKKRREKRKREKTE